MNELLIELIQFDWLIDSCMEMSLENLDIDI